MKTIAVSLMILGLAFAAFSAEETLTFGRFGQVALYSASAAPAQVAIFISGDGGWNLGVVDMARNLTALDALVVGVDMAKYMKALQASEEKCLYPAADFEALSKYVQMKLGYPEYRTPVLVGYSSGATLVYALLVQAPPGTFKGAMSLGFCPDLPLLKPLCKGSGLEWKPGAKGKGVVFQPAPDLKMPWVAFQGLIDQVCESSLADSYVKQTGSARLINLPKVGHGFSVQKNWMPQFKEAFRMLAGSAPAGTPVKAPEVDGLPLVEVQSQADASPFMAVILSGDGGWASIDRSLGEALAGRGIPVVGLDSLKYFWKKRNPEQAAADLERILGHYLAAWKKEKALLIGYSLGADVLPFMAARLGRDASSHVALVALLGPSKTVEFEFHLTEWLGGGSHKDDLPVLPEVKKLEGKRILCIHGDDEKDGLCDDLDAALARNIVLKGGHHFGGDYGSIADEILKEIQP